MVLVFDPGDMIEGDRIMNLSTFLNSFIRKVINCGGCGDRKTEVCFGGNGGTSFRKDATRELDPLN
jgi:hypothetical protein